MDDIRTSDPAKIAQAYIGSDIRFKLLGSGVDGFVYSTATNTAVKVFTYREKFDRELAVYLRLLQRNVIEILGFAVPRLIDWDEAHMVIELTTVNPPYLLDFAGSVLDEPLEFPEGEEEWWGRVADNFEPDQLDTVRRVYDHLRSQLGIHYYDLKPRNMSFDQHSDFFSS